ncbi:hypothetical protein [Streptomyces mirabilis]|uniref:hypothetical protein n=1 Tax=Streptomyces mirabilis TaxID=68239 RepID=UPI003662AF0A
MRISQTVDWGDLDAEEGEFAVDAAIPPRAVFAGEAEDEGADRGVQYAIFLSNASAGTADAP